MNELQEKINADRERRMADYLAAKLAGKTPPDLSTSELLELGLRSVKGAGTTTGGFTIPGASKGE